MSKGARSLPRRRWRRRRKALGLVTAAWDPDLLGMRPRYGWVRKVVKGVYLRWYPRDAVVGSQCG